MKIGFVVVCFNENNTIFNVNALLCNELATSNKNKVSLISNDVPKFNGQLNKRINRYILKIKPGRINKFVTYFFEMRKLMQNNYFDVLVLNQMEFCLFGFLACYKKAKLISYSHRNSFDIPKFRFEWLGNIIAANFFNAMVVLTKKDKNNLKTKYKDTKIYQIYNITNNNEDTRKYNLSSKKILNIGGVTEDKGFYLLIEVMKLVVKKRNEWKCDIFGGLESIPNLKEIIINNNLENNVFLKGYCLNLKNKMKDYSIFVMTSKSEGLGNVLIEAKKANLPIVSFDINCGPSDCIKENENGFLIEPYDVEKMSNRIIELIDDEKKRKTFSTNSSININEFDTKFIVNRWNSLFDDIKEQNSI